MSRIRHTLGLAASLCASAAALAQAQSYRDTLVQPPTLAAPKRGSVAGAYGDLSYTPAQLARGSYTLPSPIDAPTDRGPLLGDVLPTYNPDGGLSEWGMGWSGALTIQRHRDVGELDYETDDFLTPWGVAVRGDDGAYYPRGLTKPVRLLREAGRWVATTADGTAYTFSPEHAISTARGTYRWYVSAVQTVHGDRTEYSYDFNESGRPFLQRVSYGGRGGALQHALELYYEPIEHVFTDYRSGEAVELDRRVARVESKTRHAMSGDLELRWTHTLRYEDSPAGTAFYLSQVTKTYASGEAEPPMTYRYHMAEAVLAETELQHLEGLDDYLAQAGGDAIQPDVVAFLDIDNDGRTDMEHAARNTLVRHTEEGWTFSALPPASGTHRWCRPTPSPYNQPRRLVRMTPDADTPHVVVVKPRARDTGLMICSYEGVPVHRALLPADFALGPNTRLVDLDRDLRPDFIRVQRGRYDVVRNVSVPGDFGFRATPGGPLSPAFSPSASWIMDMNGDGVADIVSRFESGVVIWSGVGALRFAPEGRTFRFVTRHGSELHDVDGFQFTFTDANKDGLTDVLLSRSQFLYLFTNRGDRFEEIVVPGLDQIDWDVGLPVAVDLGGVGEEQAVMVDGRHAYAVTLSRPESGLLVELDDGKGGGVRLRYQRARPTPGIVRRPTMLTRMEVRATGEEPIDYDYTYDEPQFHSQGRFLLGYAQVTRVSGVSHEHVRFLHDDQTQGLIARVETADPRIEDLRRVDSRRYEDALLAGVLHRRLSSQHKTWESTGHGTLQGERTTIHRYAGVCPVDRSTESRHGTLRERVTLATPTALAGALHCLAEKKLVTGTHPGRPALDFSHEVTTERDAHGQVVRVRSGAGGALLVQSLGYDELGRLRRITAAAGGETRIEYDGETSRIRRITGPDGVVREVEAYDPITDDILTLAEDRGQRWRASFRYDGLERLARSWDNLGQDGAASPAVTYEYSYADALRPGRVFTRTLVDGLTGSHAERVELMSATGKPLAVAAAYDGGWSFSQLTRRRRASAREERYHRGPVARGSLWDLGVDQLYADASLLGSRTRSAFGHTLQESRTLQEDVARAAAESVGVDEATLTYVATENGARPITTRRDSAGRPLSVTNAAGETVRLAYDALGRLVDVTLADATTHQRVRYDQHGRPRRVTHDLSGGVDYAYDPSTGDLVRKTFTDRDGALMRTETLTRDALGRVVARVHRSADGSEQRVFTYEHDGELGGAPALAGQLGRQTSVRAEDFSEVTAFQPDGRPATRTLTLQGLGAVRVEFRYMDNGEPRSELHTVVDPAGVERARVLLAHTYDDHGRRASTTVNGQPLMSFTYDDENRVSLVSLPDGEVIAPLYDPVTHQERGYFQGGERFSLTFEPVYNTRGLIAREKISYADRDGAEAIFDRVYGYDARRYLVSQDGEAGAARYAYDALGLLTHIEDAAGARDLRRAGDQLTVGEQVYTLDRAGRVIARGDLELRYGPDGALAQATRAGRVFQFSYDQNGERLLKRADGAVVEAYPFGALLTRTEYIQPVKILGRVVGLLVNGRYRGVPTDVRGTALANTEGGLSDVSPYGQRSDAVPYASALAYAAKGYDADLGLVRMGRRDYDPFAGQFITPDPLFAENIKKCAESPAECALYGYAVNNPVSFVDPTGTEGEACYPDKAARFQIAVDNYRLTGTYLYPEFRRVEVQVGHQLSRGQRYDLLMRAHGMHPYRLSDHDRLKSIEHFMSYDEYAAEFEARKARLIKAYQGCGGGPKGARCRVRYKSIAGGPKVARYYRVTGRELREGSRMLTGAFAGAAAYWNSRVRHGLSHDQSMAAGELANSAVGILKGATGPRTGKAPTRGQTSHGVTLPPSTSGQAAELRDK